MNTKKKSLDNNQWFKLICGASLHHLPTVRNVALAYAIAGADCIDVAADPAVVRAVQEALWVAQNLRKQAQEKGYPQGEKPWVMVSFNDGEDPHFRKAFFDESQCPHNCPRPCEKICPAKAIAFTPQQQGVIEERCYGCGRCIPLCPLGLIEAKSHVFTAEAIAPMIQDLGIEAIEIHTRIGRLENFKRLWGAISGHICNLKLLAISCNDGPGLIEYLQSLYHVIQPLSCLLIWQTDGKPMSGDTGKRASYAAVALAQKVIQAKLPGYVQLAGGTNNHTVKLLQELGLTQAIAGVAYGSYARNLLIRTLEKLEAITDDPQIENYPTLLWESVARADLLIKQLKPKSSRLG